MQDIAPKFLKQNPMIHLSIAGKNMPNALKKEIEKRDWITYLDFLNDIRTAFSNASLFINPMRIAKGINTKVIEAMAMGKAVVSYRTGIEGLPLESGVDLMIADNSEHFAAHIKALISNFQLREKMGKMARKKAEKHFDWENILPILDSIFI
jgi:glycosyltransferase involved in cell wall biosynthesis